MRTVEEIVARVKERAPEDILEFEVPYYIICLPFKDASQFLNDTTEEYWNTVDRPSKDEHIRKQMTEYMPFAWEKANGCRGLSAARSLAHYKAWLWLLGQEGWDEKIRNYQFYGKDVLVEICGFLGLDATQWDDGRRVNTDTE